MKNLLIVKAFSRLGMKFIPHGGTVLNLGVEKGPSAVLSEEFLAILQQNHTCTVLEYTFSNPDEVAADNYYATVAKETKELARMITDALATGTYDGVVTVGGDHSIALGSLLGILNANAGKKIGLIDFDSHGDIHLVHTSPSGNFHGMWLRPFLSEFDNTEISDVIDAHLPPENVLYIGDLLTEDEENRFIAEKNITIIGKDSFDADRSLIQQQITDFCARFDVIHVTFDIDVFKQSLVSATGTPNPDGFDEEMIACCLAPILESNKLFSVDLVEVNPDKPGAKETTALAQKVITDFTT